ncbi:MAG TPA: ABC transporter ATP-binding protein [Candidatus Limnocylindria bacterium]|jgi:sulfonate transport system ATP-binding protein|nr:ABC transporter ATP-binding protein [Candidatus Limnocylindria bacterium]
MSRPLVVRELRKRYGDLPVLGGVGFDVAPSEIVAVVGPSGCGKSTLLRLVAGLDTRYHGEIQVGDEKVCGPHPSIGLVFQEPRLFPWLTVADNVAFGLREREDDAARAHVRDALEAVGLSGFGGALPKELSGGMAQRVALARSLVTEPQVLLLDEPFSSLDAFTRMRLQDHLQAAWTRYRPTLLMVTHDLDEAVYLADRVLVFGERPGRLVDVIPIAPPRPRDRRDPALAALRVALLEAVHLDRGERAVA